MRRAFLKQAAALSASIAVPSLAFAQAEWPSRPIKVLVPFPPGGALDPIARALGARMGGFLGQPIVVENRPGGGTAIAAGAVAKGEPDGHTILITSPITHVLPTMQMPRGYDAIKDFAPISAVSRGDFSLAVHPSVPAKTLAEFIAWGKANPDKISASISSTGGADHLATELFKLATGIKLTIVPYKGSGPALVDLLAGRIQMMIIAHSLVQQHIEAGKLRMLAYATQPVDKPPAPTLVQAGMKEFEPFITMNIILAPAATPAPVVAKLASAIQRSLETPETRSAIQSANQVPFFMPPDKLREKLVNDSAFFADIVQKTGIKFE
jgi:tripartite-type tricarboxylate transporter receptor subunit TctC